MKYYGKAETVARGLLDMFERGNVPAAMAHVFIRSKDAVPCRSWSWSNQLITAIFGRTDDARGFRQWERAGRHVNKGSKAFHILAPCTRTIRETDADTGEETERVALYGFKSVPVFRVEDTDGEPILERDPEIASWIESLPLLDVAKSWGLDVSAFNARPHSHLGRYWHDKSIALGVKNLLVWAHELVHSSDHRLNGLNGGQHIDQEVVAQFGGSILLRCLGLQAESDPGDCWRYVQSYAKGTKKQVLSVCIKLLDRACKAVANILEQAEKVKGASMKQTAA